MFFFFFGFLEFTLIDRVEVLFLPTKDSLVVGVFVESSSLFFAGKAVFVLPKEGVCELHQLHSKKVDNIR